MDTNEKKEERITDFSFWLSENIRRKGISHAQLADDLGVARVTLSRWLNAGRTPHPVTMEKIKKYFAGTYTPDRDPDGIMELYYSSPPDYREAVRNLLKMYKNGYNVEYLSEEDG